VLVLNFIKKFFAAVFQRLWGVVETQRDIVSEAKVVDQKLQVRRDRINPDNYTSFKAHGVLLCMRKTEVAEWNRLDRHERRRLANQYKTRIKKGELVYKEYDGVTLLVDPKKVLDPNLL
jgi:hypothetical protein